MSGAAGAAGRGAGSERGAAGPWGRGWPARRGGKGKRSLPSVESPVHPVVFARAVSSTGDPLSTPHGITSVIKGEPNWSGSSTNRVCVACSCVEVSNFRLGQSISHHEHEQCPTAGRLSSSRPAGAGRSGLNVPSRRAAALAARTPELGTTHAQQRRGTASVSVWSVWRFGLRGRALRINSAFRHPSSPSETAGSRFVGFRRAGAWSGIRARLAATDDPYRWRGAGGPNARCGLVSPLAAAAADRLRTTVTLNTPGAPIDKLHDTLHRCQRLVDKGVHSHRSTCTCVVVFR